MSYYFYGFLFLLFFACVFGFIRGLENHPPELISLPHNDKNYSESNNRNVLIVSTIDGTISAFKSSDGSKMWSINTEPGNLFSSSLSELEFLFHGQKIQVIPSLDGYLYKFDGRTLEPLPVSAEMLLSTSYRIGDNANIVGGREVQSYGINLGTGELHYICTSEGCQQISDTVESDDVLVIERHTQTVRAVNFRTGDDLWHYKVGEHRVNLSKGLKLKLPSTHKVTSMKRDFNFATNGGAKDMSSAVKVAMMKGFIGEVDHSTNEYKWTQKLSSPIVDVWQVNDDTLKLLDLFEQAGFATKNTPLQSLLLVGAYEKKLYIKQSTQIEAAKYVRSLAHNYPSNMSYFMPIFPEKTNLLLDSTSLALKYPSHEYENGMFFIKNNPNVSNTTHCFAKKSGNLSSLKEKVLSFLQKWQDAIFTSFIASIFTNILCYIIWKGFLRRRSQMFLQDQNPTNVIPNDPVAPDKDVEDNLSEEQANVKDMQMNDSSLSSSSIFQSRYLNDFDCIECLGKGGYGVVFKVKNKIDCCSYAVKRIKFSKSHTFDRVMREVKVLAKLDHIGIVRYYNAWVESPPIEWHDSYDKGCEDLMSSSMPSEFSDSNLESRKESSNPSNFHNKELSKQNLSRQFRGGYSSNSWSSGVVFQNSDDQSCSKDNTGLESGEILKTDPDTEGDMSSFVSNHESKKPMKYLFIQMQLCRRESLKDWLNSNCEQRDQSEVLDIFYQIVCAVEYVHEQGLMHRDLKPSNIFFSLDGIVKIGDFGLVSSEHDEESSGNKTTMNATSSLKHTDEVGTKLYMSPEMAQGLDYNHKVDIFSLGLIFYELLVPFQTQFERIKVLTEIKMSEFPHSFRQEFPKECKLAAELLKECPENRPSAADIKEDPIFEAVGLHNLERKRKPRTLSGTSKQSSTEDDEDICL